VPWSPDSNAGDQIMPPRSTLKWKVHTPNMLAEIVGNRGLEVMAQPLNIFANILAEVATRAAEIDDPALNILMMRLTLYDQVDPEKFSTKEIHAAYATQEARIAAALS
jgi:hypothetical protein